MSTLTRDAILAAQDLVTKTIEVKEWGGSINIRSLTGADRAQLQKLYFESAETAEEKFDIYMLVFSIVDDAGNRMFTAQDVEQLAKKSAAAINRVSKEIKALSGMGEAKVEQAEGN